jgi:hypothetical protein
LLVSQAIETKARRRLVLAAVAGLVVLGAVVGKWIEGNYLDRRYQADRLPLKQNPGYRSTYQWKKMVAWARDQRDQRIGIAGLSAAYGQYLFYGEDLSNDVEYIGEHRPHGGLRPIPTCQAWREAVNASDLDYVLVTPVVQTAVGPVALGATWTRGDPAATRVVDGGSGAVYKISGDLDPAGCPADEAGRGTL